MDIKSLAEQYNDYIIDRRRYYHTCPELSGEEKNTRAHLKEDLEALGITDIHELETCYGLTATIHGGKPGKTVGLRTDTDALSFQEETGLPFASCEPSPPTTRARCTPAAMTITWPCCWAPPRFSTR